MKKLTKYINEWKYDNDKNVSYKPHEIYKRKVKDQDELDRTLNAMLRVEIGPGTKDKPADLNDIDISAMDNLSEIFFDSEFEYIDISNWDVTNVVNVSRMFYRSKLKSINMSNWNLKKFEWGMGGSQVFDNCKNLKVVDLSNIKETEPNWNFISTITDNYKRSKIKFIEPKWVEEYR